jgi:hypothetical protein
MIRLPIRTSWGQWSLVPGTANIEDAHMAGLSLSRKIAHVCAGGW